MLLRNGLVCSGPFFLWRNFKSARRRHFKSARRHSSGDVQSRGHCHVRKHCTNPKPDTCRSVVPFGITSSCRDRGNKPKARRGLVVESSAEFLGLLYIFHYRIRQQPANPLKIAQFHRVSNPRTIIRRKFVKTRVIQAVAAPVSSPKACSVR